jgi:hypothetical protein
MLALLMLYSLQAADLETVRLCVPAADGHVTAELGFVRTDGVWWTPPQDTAASQQRFDASIFPTARNRNWFLEKGADQGGHSDVQLRRAASGKLGF